MSHLRSVPDEQSSVGAHEAAAEENGQLFPVPQHGSPTAIDSDFATSLLALSSVRGLGRKGLTSLHDVCGGDLAAVWAGPASKLQSALERSRTPGADRIARAILDEADTLLTLGREQKDDLVSRGVSVISRRDLPPSLRDARDGPRWLFVEGHAGALHSRPSVAVVGTRRPTEQGIRATRRVTRILAAYPINLVSGLAEGIDAEAHAASLRDGVTNIAFLGHGIRLTFPSSTAGLRRDIVGLGGAVVTEYLPDDHYTKANFVERNRLQALLADSVIPVEGGIKGGTSHTVRFSRRYKRPVIGIAWPGGDGLLDELRRAGDEIIDIWEPSGTRRLDELFRALGNAAGRQTSPLDLARRFVEREIAMRSVSREDLDRFADWLRAFSADA
jgi:DNA processing protein